MEILVKNGNVTTEQIAKYEFVLMLVHVLVQIIASVEKVTTVLTVKTFSVRE
jgi:hypothetical protein